MTACNNNIAHFVPNNTYKLISIDPSDSTAMFEDRNSNTQRYSLKEVTLMSEGGLGYVPGREYTAVLVGNTNGGPTFFLVDLN